MLLLVRKKLAPDPLPLLPDLPPKFGEENCNACALCRVLEPFLLPPFDLRSRPGVFPNFLDCDESFWKDRNVVSEIDTDRYQEKF